MTSPLLRDLLTEIEQGRYAVPEIQRPYVWTNPQVRELFESIYKGYPIGSIIVWEPAPEIFEEYGDLFRAFSKELEDRRRNFKYVVIDGQQRLLSLWLAKRGRVTIVDTYGHERERTINLYYNVDNDEFFVDRARKKYENDPYVYRISDILDYVKFEDVEDLVESKEVDESIQKKKIIKKLRKVRDSLLNYPVNVYTIPESVLKYRKEGDDDNFLEIFEKISQMFVRLNYTGTRVRAPHLIIALLTGKTRRVLGVSFRKMISKLVSKLDEEGWDIGEGALMRTYLVIATKEPRFSRARRMLNELSANQIKEYLEKLDVTLMYVVNKVLKYELNIKKPSFLKSEYVIVPITYYAYIKENRLTPSDIKGLIKWLILASFNRRYTGRLDTDMAEDIASLTKSKDITTLIKNLQTSEIQEEWLDRSVDREHLTMMSIILRDSYDLMRDATIRIRDIDGKHIHIHHIFPRSQIQKYYKEYGSIGDMDLETAYNHVANITIISETANENIGNKLPYVYLSEIDSEILKSHMIPLDKELWKLENYPQFLEARKQLIMEKKNELIEFR